MFIHSFIHSDHFYSTSSSPLLLRSAPDTAQILCRNFTLKRHRQLWVNDLPKVPTWWLEWESNPPRPFKLAPPNRMSGFAIDNTKASFQLQRSLKTNLRDIIGQWQQNCFKREPPVDSSRALVGRYANFIVVYVAAWHLDSEVVGPERDRLTIVPMVRPSRTLEFNQGYSRWNCQRRRHNQSTWRNCQTPKHNIISLQLR